MNEPTPTQTPTVPAPPAPAPTLTAPVVEPHSKNGLSAAEATMMVGWTREDLASGKLSNEQAEKIFSGLNATPEQRAGDQRTDEEKKIDQVFGVRAKESDFNPIQYYPPGQAPAVLPKEVVAFDQSAKAWMGPSGAGLTVEAGNALVTHISHALQETQHMSPDELITYAGTEHLKLQRAHGAQLPERLRAVDDMIDELELQRPGLLQLLETKGIGKNALVWNLLIQAATPYHARRKVR